MLMFDVVRVARVLARQRRARVRLAATL